MTQQEFDLFFTKHYKQLTYMDVKKSFELFYQEQNGKLFHDDYKDVTILDFEENLLEDAKFQFQDILLEAFYDKNPDIYEQAFAIFEENGGVPSEVTKIFDDTYKQLYHEFLETLFFKN